MVMTGMGTMTAMMTVMMVIMVTAVMIINHDDVLCGSVVVLKEKAQASEKEMD